MTTRVTATVIHGMLKPDEGLDLADQTRVQLTIEPLDEVNRQPAQAWAALQERLRLRPIHALGLRFTQDELHERR